MAEKDKPELHYGETETPEAETTPNDKAPGKPKEPRVELPALGEFTVLVSTVVLVIAFLGVLITSWLTGASVAAIVLRVSVTLLVIGGLLAFIARQIITGMAKAGMVVEPQSNKDGQLPTQK